MKLKESLSVKLFGIFFSWFKNKTREDKYFIFFSTSIFYFFLFFVPNNKILAVAFAFYIIILFFRTRNLSESLFWGLIASLPFGVGKTYNFILIPPNELYQPDNPNGYEIIFVLTVSIIIAFFILPYLFRLFISWIKTKRKIFNWDDFLIVFLFILFFLSTVNSQNIQISFLSLLPYLVCMILFFYNKYLINFKDKNNLDTLILLLFVQAIFESILAIVQFIFNGPLGRVIESMQMIVPFGKGVDEDIWRFRPTGTFEHANILAITLVFFILISFTYFYTIKDKSKALIGKLSIWVFILSTIALILTLGRSAWLSLFLGFISLTYIFEKKLGLKIKSEFKKVFFIGIFVLFLLFPYFVLPRLIASFNIFMEGGGLNTRLVLISQSLEVISQNPVLGVGFGMSVPTMFRNNPLGMMYYFPTPVHCWYLHIASETGLLSLLFFILLINSCLRKVFLKKEKEPIYFAVLVAMTAVLFNGIFQPFLVDNYLIFIILGIFSSLALSPKSNKEENS